MNQLKKVVSPVDLRLAEIERFNSISGFLDKPVDPKLEFNMLLEELNEYQVACANNDEAKIKDSLGDLMVVLWGTILKHGYKEDFWPTYMSLINDANFSKFCATEEEAADSVVEYQKKGIDCYYIKNQKYSVWVVKRKDGKTLKSINWKEPDFGNL